MLMPDPKILLVVAQIVPQQLPGDGGADPKNAAVKAYNAAIPGVVQTRIDAGRDAGTPKHIVVVDMFGAFTANPNFSTVLLNDRLHPNDAGYRVMADTWYAAIRQYLK
jgi:lysophospholipase L1-like esterase